VNCARPTVLVCCAPAGWALHLACTFDFNSPELNNAEIEHLIPMINSQMWVGHFEFWPTERLVVFRPTLVPSGGVPASRRQCEVLLSAALDACERYYWRFSLWPWPARERARKVGSFLPIRV
jgi:hypothetical protein